MPTTIRAHQRLLDCLAPTVILDEPGQSDVWGRAALFVKLCAPQAAHHGHRRDATARDATARDAAACSAAASLRCRRACDATTLTMPPLSLLDR
jgi:hypothetical protein